MKVQGLKNVLNALKVCQYRLKVKMSSVFGGIYKQVFQRVVTDKVVIRIVITLAEVTTRMPSPINCVWGTLCSMLFLLDC